MLSEEEYLKNPCGRSSVPFWKTKFIVLPDYRGRGIGRSIVNELLRRAKGRADFAAVSGRADGGAESIYRKCGFVGTDVWHILRKKQSENRIKIKN